MTKVLMWLLAIWIIWFMIRNYFAKERAKETRKQSTRQALPQKMVKCDHCSVHMPQSTALQHDAQWFCTEAHRQAWLAEKQTRN